MAVGQQLIRNQEKLHQAAAYAPRSAQQRKSAVLNYLDIYTCIGLIVLTLYAKSTRRLAISLILMGYLINTSMAYLLHLDSYTFYICALLFDVGIGVSLMWSYSDSKPLYIVHTLIILIAMCFLNVLGAILYSIGDNGYFYVGAMFVANCALVIRLLISTRRDGDGSVEYSLLGSNGVIDNSKVPTSSKGMES